MEQKMSEAAKLFMTIEEHPEPLDAIVTGVIPSWVRGNLLRVGPGKYEHGETKYNHWFDGEALLHKFEIKDNGKVEYSNRFLRSKSYVESEKRGCIAMSSFATIAPPDPCKNMFERFFSYFTPLEVTDNCNVNVVNIKGHPVASTEAPAMWRIDPEDLGTEEKLNIKAKLGGMRGWLAHPHEDAEGNYYNLSSIFTDGSIQIVKIPHASEENKECLDGTEIIGQFRPHAAKLPYHHSFGMTENYFVHVENPLFMSNLLALAFMKIMNWSFLDLIKEDKSQPTIISLLDRKTAVVKQRYIADHFFVFHHINAYEDGDDLVVDLCGYDDASIIRDLYLSNLRSDQYHHSALPSIRRYRLSCKSDFKDPVTLPKRVDDIDYELIYGGLELPRINYTKCNGKPYKYVYGVILKNKTDLFDYLAKVNVDTKQSYEWREDDAYVSEPVFLEAPDAEEEDDGVVLSMVARLGNNTSFLLVLDAKTFKEIARAEVPYQFVPTIHGDFWRK